MKEEGGIKKVFFILPPSSFRGWIAIGFVGIMLRDAAASAPTIATRKAIP